MFYISCDKITVVHAHSHFVKYFIINVGKIFILNIDSYCINSKISNNRNKTAYKIGIELKLIS